MAALVGRPALSRCLRVVCVLTALTMLGTACSAGEDETTPGVTATTVTIGSHQALTGPAATGSSVAPAAKAYFDYVNDHGGVNGRKIIFDYRDDAYVPANALTVVRKLVEKDKVFAVFGGFGTSAHQAVAGYLNAHKVPDLFPISGCPCWNDPAKLPYTFGWHVDYIREGKILGTYVAKAFPAKRIAYFYQDDELGKSGVAGLDMVIPASRVVARGAYRFGYSAVTTAAQAIIRAKPDIIISFSLATYTALLRLAQKKAGDTSQLVVSQVGSDPTALATLLSPPDQPNAPGQSNPLLQGIITDAQLPPVADTSNRWIALVKKIHDSYIPSQPMNRYTEMGVASAYTFVEALQRAGRNLTRQSLINALQRGGLSRGPGLTPLEYSPTSHAGYTGVQIGVIKDNGLVLQGWPMVTDDGRGAVKTYKAPPTRVPPGGIPSP
ncbi:ABC transporter substrate-binding protein [Streptomyces sp. NPDC101151]|uniref:ABC transporter substrate-binding protein n=1 Tax=Streptomyces sp. NPDC101151 TaxID=3366115 RepID=UPI00381E8084